MTQGPDKLPLLLAEGAEVAVAHVSSTVDKDYRPVTNAKSKRGLFLRLK